MSEKSILDVVREYVWLTPAGSTYKGLCPFHAEKTPSFHVHPGKGFWHCFGCGEGGTAAKFLERIAALTVGRTHKVKAIPSTSCRFCEFRVSTSPAGIPGRHQSDRLITYRNDHEHVVHYGAMAGLTEPMAVTKVAAPRWSEEEWFARARRQGFER